MATGLLDITLATETVAGVTVKGISAKGISYLLAKYPDFRKAMTGQALNLSVEKIMVLAPDCIAAIIAVGCGDIADEAAEAKAAELPVGMQAEFLEPILRLTMPGGVGPFVAALEKLGDFAAEGFGKVVVTKSVTPS